MQSLEAKKLQRKLGGLGYTSTSHDRIHTSISSSSSSSSSVIVYPSPRKPPLSPRISPRTPTPMLHITSPLSSPNCNSAASSNDTLNELVATSKSAVAEVEVKFSGPNLVLNTLSHPIPGQLVKILAALQHLSLDILQLNINKLDQTILTSFTIKVPTT